MKILVVDYAGHPFQYDLSAELGSVGHDVTHSYSSTTVTPQTSFSAAENVHVRPVDIGRPFERYKLIRRLRDECRYGWGTVRLAREVNPDRVLASNVPLVSLAMLWIWATIRRVPHILWLQDVQSGLARLVTGKASAVTRVLGALEWWLIRRSTHVVAISDGFAQLLADEGIDPAKVTTIENWAPLDHLPTRSRVNSWSSEHGLNDKFVFLYSGTLGKKHSPELLLGLAREFASDDDVAVVVVSEGSGTDWLREQSACPATLLPFQDFAVLPDVLASADVLVVLLDPDAGAMSVPSKTLTYLCAGRPILGAIPDENAAAILVAERASAGIIVRPGDVGAFVGAARELRVSTELSRMRDNARRYAVANFQREGIARRFLTTMNVDGSTENG